MRDELAVITDRLTRNENGLSEVELELIYDARDDRTELDALRERLPQASHPLAMKIFEDFERKHTELLNRRRDGLEKLTLRASNTEEQIQRRLQILEDHFNFIRANLFWVRDEEPVGFGTLVRARRELPLFTKSVARIIAEGAERRNWGSVSPEFLAACVGLLILPWPLYRLRRSLRLLAGPSLAARPAAVPQSNVK